MTNFDKMKKKAEAAVETIDSSKITSEANPQNDDGTTEKAVRVDFNLHENKAYLILQDEEFDLVGVTITIPRARALLRALNNVLEEYAQLPPNTVADAFVYRDEVLKILDYGCWSYKEIFESVSEVKRNLPTDKDVDKWKSFNYKKCSHGIIIYQTCINCKEEAENA